MHEALSVNWLKKGILSTDKIRIDSSVVASNIAPPSDSQLLNDGVRVLSRLLMKSQNITGVKIRFTDQRKPWSSLAFHIFNAKKSGKEVLYPKQLKTVRLVLKQVDRGLEAAEVDARDTGKKKRWVSQVEQYRDLTLNVIDQTERRVIQAESVH